MFFSNNANVYTSTVFLIPYTSLAIKINEHLKKDIKNFRNT